MILKKPKLLLQACCGPCATVALLQLCKMYAVTIFFTGDNLNSESEFQKRLNALQMVNKELSQFADTTSNIAPAVVDRYTPQIFLDATRGLEGQPERGKRCEICYNLRLEAAAAYAKENGFSVFASTLTTSPHKNAVLVNELGNSLAKKYGVTYLETDFKKNNGFANSVQICKQLGIYRQSYCGCQSSVRH